MRWREIGLIAGLTHSTAEPSTLGDCWEGGLPCEHGASAPDDGREMGTGTGSVSSKSVHYVNCAPPTPEPLWTERTEESSMGASQVSLGKLCVHIRCWGWMVLKS